MLSDDDEGSGGGYTSEPKENSEPSKESNSQQETGKFNESLQKIRLFSKICSFKLMALSIVHFVFR